MMTSAVSPKDIAPPLARYAHGILAEPGCRWLYVSGQVGVRPDGTMTAGIDEQLEQTFENLFAVLRAGGMEKQHLVKLTVFLTRQADVGAWRAARDHMLEGAETASTLLVVAGLASP